MWAASWVKLRQGRRWRFKAPSRVMWKCRAGYINPEASHLRCDEPLLTSASRLIQKVTGPVHCYCDGAVLRRKREMNEKWAAQQDLNLRTSDCEFAADTPCQGKPSIYER